MTLTVTAECKHYADRLRGLAAYVLGATKDDLTQEQAVFQLNGCKSNIAWVIGHLTLTLDHDLLSIIDGTPKLPESFNTKYNHGVIPTNNPDDYEPINELIAKFQETSERVAACIEEMDPALLDREIPEESLVRQIATTPRAFIDAITYHSGYHAGQITMLRAEQGLPAGYGM
jgi:uncharacterized damage-inducible protein DinB